MPEMSDDDLLKKHLSKNHVVIVDGSSGARTCMASSLIQFGATRAKMSLVGTIEEARSEILRTSSKIVFCDYQVGKKSGLDLIQDQRRELDLTDMDDTLFFLVTSNASQAAVARAAEEDVDAFVLKPYTLATLQKCLSQAVAAKINPTAYTQLILQGKSLSRSENVSDAKMRFQDAKKLEKQPTLACYYLGKTEKDSSSFDEAEKLFLEGLAFNAIHYKCLSGLFELLSKRGKHTEAYEIIKRLTQYFPNPRRPLENPPSVAGSKSPGRQGVNLSRAILNLWPRQA